MRPSKTLIADSALFLIWIYFTIPVPAAARDQEYVVSTIAGGLPPATPVAARDASIGGIRGLAVDAGGDVYLSTDLHCVFKVDPGGTLTRFAGTCQPGYAGDGGPAVNARLNDPQGLAVGPKGVVYIADHGNWVVREVRKDGTIVTVAGNGRSGLPVDGSPATDVQLPEPQSVAADSAGNLYIGEGYRVYRVSTDGTIHNLAGNDARGDSKDGDPATRALVGSWVGLAVDKGGNLYIADGSRVRRVSAAGTITTVAANRIPGYSGGGGPATNAELGFTISIALDRHKNLYIADSGKHRIRKVSPDGAISTFAGAEASGTANGTEPTVRTATASRFVAVDAHGNLYVAGDSQDTDEGRLQRISPDGVVTTLVHNGWAYSGDGGAAVRAQLYSPGSLALDLAGNLYVTDSSNARIRKIDKQGTISTVAGDGTCCIAREGVQATRSDIGPYTQLAVDHSGNLYIAQYGSQRVRKVSADGVIRTIAGTGSAGFSGDGGPASLARLNYPEGIASDSAGNLYVADMVNQRVRKVTPDGTITTVAGDGKAGDTGDGNPALEAELNNPGELITDSQGNLYIFDYQGSCLRKLSPDGTISTVTRIPDARAIAMDAAGTLYAVANHKVVRVSPKGNLETIAGTGEAGYTGDGGPALDARFGDIGGIAVDPSGKIYISDSTAHAIRMLSLAPVQLLKPSPQEPKDLVVVLRSATGSNRFRMGEEIPLEVVLSSSTPKRYLEPCRLFNESGFGFPQCRFFNRWSFAVRPAGGWTDLEQEFPRGPRTGGGPTFTVPNPDLSSQPVVYPYLLTQRFRFDEPGTYHVRFSLDVGLDDETTQLKPVRDQTVQPHAVKVQREILLEVVAASPQWQAEIVRKGLEAYSASPLPRANPNSPEVRENQDARKAFCNLGTPEAARAYARLLLRNDLNRGEEANCLEQTASPTEAIQEMERLLVDPNVPVDAGFFQVLVRLLGRDQSRMDGMTGLSSKFVNAEREKLFAALPQKRGEAQITSLLTVLMHGSRGPFGPGESPYDLPFAPPVMAAAAANFDRFPPQSQAWLLDSGWDGVRSPLMLPVVRQKAMAGDGQALLRWLELDPPAARGFVYDEIIRAIPRFSSFYLRLPVESLPLEEAKIASNFVALTSPEDLMRAATLLHRYTTGAVLPTVLPVIDAQRGTWPCSILVPALAYVLKVSPDEAEPRIKQALAEANRAACQSRTLFTDIGFMEPGPALDRLALAEIDRGPNSFATDAALYLRKHGTPAMKPLVYEELAKWHQKFIDSGTENRVINRTPTADDNALNVLTGALVDTYTRAQGWLLTPQEAANLEAMLGTETTGRLICAFHCGGSLWTDTGAPSYYWIYGRMNQNFDPRLNSMEFLKPVERLYYSINQYRCDDMKALEDKIVQFPKGSSFGFAYDFSAADKDEILEIITFLREHGYKAVGPHTWSFWPADSAR